MSSIAGLIGLKPTLKSIKFTKKILIANKEAIICGWSLINKELKKVKLILYQLTQNIFLFGHYYQIIPQKIFKKFTSQLLGDLFKITKKKFFKYFC